MSWLLCLVICIDYCDMSAQLSNSSLDGRWPSGALGLERAVGDVDLKRIIVLVNRNLMAALLKCSVISHHKSVIHLPQSPTVTNIHSPSGLLVSCGAC